MGVVEVGPSLTNLWSDLVIKEMICLFSRISNYVFVNFLLGSRVRGFVVLAFMGHWLACGVPSE